MATPNNSDNDKVEALIISLFKVDGLKFGSFTLKSGIISPVYFDLRVIVSHPEILKAVSDLVGDAVIRRKNDGARIDLLCGVPYTALPIASLVSVNQGLPMVLKRKEQKSYGTGKLIEGSFTPGDHCLLIEDVVTSGSSVVETAASLRSAGLVVNEAIVILDRSQGASHNLVQNSIIFTPLISMDRMLTVLGRAELISHAQIYQVSSFLAANQLFDPGFETILSNKLIPCIASAVSRKLVEIMAKKFSNLCLSVDLTKWEDVVEAVELLGDKICMVKTHIDTIGLKGGRIIGEFWEKLKALSTKHNFLIMEDRKFGDIGSTTLKQLESKPFEIYKWVDLVTIHGISGPGLLSAVEQLNSKHGNNLGVVMIAEMSSENNIPSLIPEYKKIIYGVGTDQKYVSLVAGFVSQSRPETSPVEDKNDHYSLQFTPGVSLDSDEGGDGLGQVYSSVENVVLTRGADVIIVGRGILGQPKEQWVNIAEKFRVKGWASWKKRINASFSI